MTETILVTGGAGQLGRAVVRHLLASEGVAPSQLIVATREPAKLAGLVDRGVAVRRADFDDPATLAAAFAGAQRALIISTDTLDLTGGRRVRQQRAAVEAAQRAGATHLAYTSQLEADRSPLLFATDHHQTEQAILASGAGYTLFRGNSYCENLLMPLPNMLPAALAAGRWLTAAGDGRTAYATRDDIAAAIAARLVERAPASATLELTGPVAYSVDEVAQLATSITGRAIEVVAVAEADLAAELERVGVPAPFARTLASGDSHVRAGYASATNDVLARLSRRAPTTLRQFLEANRASL